MSNFIPRISLYFFLWNSLFSRTFSCSTATFIVPVCHRWTWQSSVRLRMSSERRSRPAPPRGDWTVRGSCWHRNSICLRVRDAEFREHETWGEKVTASNSNPAIEIFRVCYFGRKATDNKADVSEQRLKQQHVGRPDELNSQFHTRGHQGSRPEVSGPFINQQSQFLAKVHPEE